MPPTPSLKTSIYTKTEYALEVHGECILLDLTLKIMRFGGVNNPQFCYEILKRDFSPCQPFLLKLYSCLSVKHKPIIDQEILEALDFEIRQSIFPLYYHGTIQEPTA